MASADKVAERVKQTVEDVARSRKGKLAAGAATAAAAALTGRQLTHSDGNGEPQGPSRKYRLKRSEPLARGIRRVTRGRLEHAVELLRDEQADPVEAVHGARKDMKKLRSALRLARPVLGERAYKRENGRFRRAARKLSGVRDAQVRAETIDALAERFADDPPPGGWRATRAALAADEQRDGLGELRERAADAIETGRGELRTLSLDAEGAALLRPGLRRAYSRGRKRYRQAAAERSDERLHEWRKRSKDLWYHLRLVRPGWRAVLEPLADEAHELADLLGDDHDLALLGSDIHKAAGEALGDEQRRHLERLIAIRRSELQQQALALGERLYAEKPKAFAARVSAYWEAGSTQ